MNKLGRELLDDAKYQGSMPCVSDKKIFSFFSYISLCKTCDPQGGPILGHRGII